MEITNDVLLRGPEWATAIDSLGELFNYRGRTNYNIYILCIAIGIMYDEVIEKPENPDQLNPRNVPRNVMMNEEQSTNKLDIMFQTAILNTKTVDFSEEERLELAFGDNGDFKKLDFLTGFANFGVTKLVEQIGISNLESMDNIRDFLVATVEGDNYDIDEISDEDIIDEIDESDL